MRHCEKERSVKSGLGRIERWREERGRFLAVAEAGAVPRVSSPRLSSGLCQRARFLATREGPLLKTNKQSPHSRSPPPPPATAHEAVGLGRPPPASRPGLRRQEGGSLVECVPGAERSGGSRPPEGGPDEEEEAEAAAESVSVPASPG